MSFLLASDQFCPPLLNSKKSTFERQLSYCVLVKLNAAFAESSLGIPPNVTILQDMDTTYDLLSPSETDGPLHLYR